MKQLTAPEQHVITPRRSIAPILCLFVVLCAVTDTILALVLAVAGVAWWMWPALAAVVLHAVWLALMWWVYR